MKALTCVFALVLVALATCDLTVLNLRDFSEVPGLSGLVSGQIGTYGPLRAFAASSVTNQIYALNPQTGEAQVIAGTGSRGHTNGPAVSATFNSPSELALGPTGEIFVADTGNHAIRLISRGTVTTVSSNFTNPIQLSSAFMQRTSDDDDDEGSSSSVSSPGGLYIGDGDSVVVATIGPANDECSGAYDLGKMSGFDKFASGNNDFARGDSIPCSYYDDDDDLITRYPANGVWYTFVGNGDQVTVSTCGQTSFDTKLYVYRADAFGTTSCTDTDLVCVGYNDDTRCGSNDLASALTFCTQDNMRYFVVVAGYSSSAHGFFTLSIGDQGPTPMCESCGCDSTWQCGSDSCGGLCESARGCASNEVCSNHICIEQPMNSFCTGAIPIKEPGTVTGDTRSIVVPASLPSGSGAPCTSMRSGGLWYVIIGTGNQATVSTCSSVTNFDTILSVYTAGTSDCGEGLMCIDYNDDDYECDDDELSSVTFCTAPGHTYYVLVMGYGSETGRFELTFTEEPSPRCNSVMKRSSVEHKHLVLPAVNDVQTLHPPLLSSFQRKQHAAEDREMQRIGRELVKEKRRRQKAADARST